jgi:hypothetical protein
MFSRVAIVLQRDSCVTAVGGRYTIEFKTMAALAEWANGHTMAEIAAYYNGLPGAKPVKKFESRDVAVTRIWAVLRPDSPRWCGNRRRLASRNSPRLRSLGRLRKCGMRS